MLKEIINEGNEIAWDVNDPKSIWEGHRSKCWDKTRPTSKYNQQYKGTFYDRNSTMTSGGCVGDAVYNLKDACACVYAAEEFLFQANACTLNKMTEREAIVKTGLIEYTDECHKYWRETGNSPGTMVKADESTRKFDVFVNKFNDIGPIVQGILKTGRNLGWKMPLNDIGTRMFSPDIWSVGNECYLSDEYLRRKFPGYSPDGQKKFPGRDLLSNDPCKYIWKAEDSLFDKTTNFNKDYLEGYLKKLTMFNVNKQEFDEIDDIKKFWDVKFEKVKELIAEFKAAIKSRSGNAEELEAPKSSISRKLELVEPVVEPGSTSFTDRMKGILRHAYKTAAFRPDAFMKRFLPDLVCNNAR